MLDAVLSVVKRAAPVAAGFGLGGPVGAALSVAGQVAGRIGADAGKRAGRNAGKVAGPVAAPAGASLLALLLDAVGINGGDVAGVLCGSPAAAGGAYGALAVWLYNLTRGAEKTRDKRNTGA